MPISNFNSKGYSTPGGLIVAKLYFATNKWEELLPDAEKALNQLVAHYSTQLKNGHKIKLTFVGRADKRASREYNWTLAMGRSIVARAYVDQRLIILGGYTADSFSTGELYSDDNLAADRRVDVYLGLNKQPPPRPPSKADLERAKRLLQKRKELETQISRKRKQIKNLKSWLKPAEFKKTNFILNLIAKIVAGGRGDPYAPPGLAEALEKESDEKMKEGIPARIKKIMREIHKLSKEIKQIDLEVARITQSK
jgi:hypothetical protein